MYSKKNILPILLLTIVSLILITYFISCSGPLNLTDVNNNINTIDDEMGFNIQVVPPDNIEVLETTQSSITLAWDAVDDALYYNVYRKMGSDGEYAKIATVVETGFTDNNLLKDTTYYYKLSSIFLINKVQTESDDSAEVEAVTAAESSLSAPSNVVASDALFTDKVEISWDVVVGATGYNIYRSTTLDSGYTLLNAELVTVTPYVDTTITADKLYYYKVRATDGTNSSDYSDPDPGYIGTLPKPAAPDGVFINNETATTLKINWMSTENATGYKVYRSTSASGTFTQTGGDISSIYLIDIGLNSNTTYYYKVSAYNPTGESDKSSVVSGKTTNYTPKWDEAGLVWNQPGLVWGQ